jgi:hypothetical protein
MKFLALFILALFSANALQAAPHCYRIDTSVTNITSAFSASNSRLSPAPLSMVKTFMVVNGTGTEIQVNCSQRSGSGYVPPPSASSPQNMNIAASEAWVPPDVTGFGNQCFIRSVDATISSGVIRLCLIGSPVAFAPY